MIHILFMILKALGILLLVLLFLVLLIVCTVLFLPFCYRAQVLKEEEGFACVKASGRVSWLFGAVALTASYEEQKPEAQILLFGASLETWKRRLKKIRRGEASVPRTEENETENAPEAEKTAEQKAPDQKEKQQKHRRSSQSKSRNRMRRKKAFWNGFSEGSNIFRKNC
jgi:flagellar biosynthesis GTPase FlhF